MLNQQPLALRNAQIKLRQRHLLEWNELVSNHQKVWNLVQQETDRKMAACKMDKLVCVILRKQQATQLLRIITNQRQVYAQMKARHQQEQTLLEQASVTPQPTLNGDTLCVQASLPVNTFLAENT